MKGYAVIAVTLLAAFALVALTGRIPEASYTQDWIVLRPYDLSVKALSVAIGVAAILTGAVVRRIRDTVALFPPGMTACFAAFPALYAALLVGGAPGSASLGIALNGGMQAAMTVVFLQLMRDRALGWAVLAALPLVALVPFYVIDGRFVGALLPTYWHGEVLAQVFKERTFGVALFVSAAINLFVLTILLSLAYFDTDHGADANASTR